MLTLLISAYISGLANDTMWLVLLSCQLLLCTQSCSWRSQTFRWGLAGGQTPHLPDCRPGQHSHGRGCWQRRESGWGCSLTRSLRCSCGGHWAGTWRPSSAAGVRSLSGVCWAGAGGRLPCRWRGGGWCWACRGCPPPPPRPLTWGLRWPAVQYSTVNYIIVQYSTVQYIILYYSTVQYIIV